MTRPLILIICDGWGSRKEEFGNAIAQASTPSMDALSAQWPHTEVEASGEAVGLPPGQQGNSEVGHLTIGSGRIVYQPLTRINRAIAGGEFFENDVLVKIIDDTIAGDGTLHCLGLVSPGGVHSHKNHGVALADLAARRGLNSLAFHVFTDGRDEPPTSAGAFVGTFIDDLRRVSPAEIATMSGRYYAMDRDNHWERIEAAYRVITGDGPSTDLSPTAYIEQQYAASVTDEFFAPVRFGTYPGINPNDSVVVWNFRPDRARHITHALADTEFVHFARPHYIEDLEMVTFTEYERGMRPDVAFRREDLLHGLAEIVSDAGLAQFHVAETEKYAHVTYFINGGREGAFAGEERLLVPSPRVATYDLAPEMSASAVADAVIQHMERVGSSLTIVNFANADMVGHTGDFAATVKGVEAVDRSIGRIADVALSRGWAIVITADHGNAELKIDPRDDSPLTAHTTSPVPVIVCGVEQASLRPGGGLQDIAPTILEVMGLPIPAEMTGTSLLAAVP